MVKLLRKRRPARSRSLTRRLMGMSVTPDGFTPIQDVNLDDIDLERIQKLSHVRYKLLERGVCPADSYRGVQQVIERYIAEEASIGVVVRELIAFLRQRGACEGRIEIALDHLVETSYFIPSKKRWYASDSPLIGFTSIGKPFYKGTGLAPSWINTDGMSRASFWE